MKKIICGLFFVMSAVAFSQQGTLFFSKSLRYNDKYELRYSFEQDNGKTCCVLAPSKATYKNTDLIYVDVLDSNMQVLSHKALNLKDGKMRCKLEHIEELDSGYTALLSFFDKKNKKKILFSQGLNPHTLQREGKLKTLISTSAKSANSGSKFYVNYTIDGNQVIYSEGARDASGFIVKVYELNNGQITSSDSLVFNQSYLSYKFKNAFYENGNIILVAYNGAAQQYEVLRKVNSQKVFEKFIFKTNNKVIKDLKSTWGAKGLLCFGLLSDTKLSQISASYQFSLGFVGDEINKVSGFFEREEWRIGLPKSHKVWSNMKIRQIIPQSNGEFLVVCEGEGNYSVSYETYNQSPYYGGYGYYGGYYNYGGGYYTTETTEYFTFNDLVVFRFDSRGEIWRALVPKKQTFPSTNLKFASAALNIEHKGIELYYLVSANKKNGIPEYNGEKFYKVVKTSVSNKGKVFTKDVFTNNNRTREKPIPSSFNFYSANCVFIGRNGLNLKYYKLR